MSHDTYVYTHESRVPHIDESYASSRHESGVPRVNESRHTYELRHIKDTTHICVYTNRSRVPRMNESYMSSRHKSGVPRVNESRHTYESTHIRVQTYMCTHMKVVSHVLTSHTSRVDIRVESHT